MGTRLSRESRLESEYVQDEQSTSEIGDDQVPGGKIVPSLTVAAAQAKV
jgi:hypothetical protein